MISKELIGQFKDAPWKRPDEIEGFVAAAGPLEPPDIVKLLDLLCSKATGDANQHRLRCTVFAKVATTVVHKGLFSHYVSALKTKDTQVRNVLATLLPACNNIPEHADLCAHLKSQDNHLRQIVAQVLKKIGGKTTVQTLGEQIQDSNFAGRMEAMDVLVQTAGHHALSALQVVLANGKTPEKQQALKYLGDPHYFGKDPTGALKAISGALNDSAEAVITQAIIAYSRHCTEDDWFATLSPALDVPSLNVVKASIEGLRRFNSPRVMLTLERKLKAGPNSVRMAVLDTLEAIGTDDILSPLVAAMSSRQITVRQRAGQILQGLSAARKIDFGRAVIWLLRSKDENVRRMAVDLAQTVKDPDGQLWPKLLAFLRDEDWWVRERVVDALVQMAGQQLTRHIAGYLNDSSEVVRRYAVDVLLRLRDPKSLGLLLCTATGDSDWWVRERAIEAVAAMKDERATPYILDIMNRFPELRIASLEALMKMDAKSTALQISTMLSDEDSDVRFLATKALEQFGDPSQSEALRSRVDDPDRRVRTAVRQLLTHWKVAFAEGVQVAKDITPLDRLLIALVKAEGDDLIIGPSRQPMVKRFGKTIPLAKNVFSPEQVKALIFPHLTPAHVQELDSLRDVDFSYEVKAEGLRFRVNVFQQAGGVAAVFRNVKGTLLELDKLGLPPIVKSLGDLNNGLVLVGGPTGAGKSTTLAALIDHINRSYGRHIISLEDPIEVLHPRKKGLVNQREIGTHTKSFSSALRATLREDPDVILVGEMRDLPTISFAISAAQTGHLVFGTIHTVAADTTVDRLINAFPGGQQDQVRSMMSETLRSVVCQYLIKRTNSTERCLALEVMVNNDAISSLIRKGKTFQIPSVISTGKDSGMQSMDSDLMRLFKESKISAEDAYMKARNKKEFDAIFAETPKQVGVARTQTPNSQPLAKAS